MATATTTKRLYTVSEAAAYLELSVAMVRRYCQNGDLAAEKAGPRAWIIRAVDLRRFHDRHFA